MANDLNIHEQLNPLLLDVEEAQSGSSLSSRDKVMLNPEICLVLDFGFKIQCNIQSPALASDKERGY